MSVRAHFVTLISLSLTLVVLSACADLLGGEGLEGQDKTLADAERSRSLGELPFSALWDIEGSFGGAPLWVSNNPEDVDSYGVLSSTRGPTQSASRALVEGSPSPELLWDEAGRAVSEAQGCAEGSFRRLDLYLAHILSSRHLSGRRRLSVVVEADEALELSYEGQMGTSGWSDLAGYKTTRADWLGAQIARDALNRSASLGLGGSPLEGRLSLRTGERAALHSLSADSLVEGGFSLESVGGCFALHVIAHDEALELSGPLPPYALGDVKWPGWYQGGGYGRAAGLYEGSSWLGEAGAELSLEEGAVGWRLFDAKNSPVALGRHGDSAELLFGGYGVVYEARLKLSNAGAECLSAHVGFTSYVKLALREGEPALNDERTPSVADLHKSDPDKRPSMLWNGPIQFSQQLRNGSLADQRVDVILTPSIAQDEWGSPINVPKGLHKPLFRWDLEPGEERLVSLLVPVPGYIVAPAAITVEPKPCP